MTRLWLHRCRVQSYDRTECERRSNGGAALPASPGSRFFQRCRPYSFNGVQTGLHMNNGHYIACARRFTDHWHTTFFNGDKLAQWIESGCQAGGNYKWSSCRVPTSSYIESAHCNQMPYKSLSDSQAHVVACIHGRKRHSVKPFKGLSVQEVQEEQTPSTGIGETCREQLVHHLGKCVPSCQQSIGRHQSAPSRALCHQWLWATACH